jgi:hypothetical protein
MLGSQVVENIYSATKQHISFGIGKSTVSNVTNLFLMFTGGAKNAQAIRINNSGFLESLAYNLTVYTDTGNQNVSLSQFIACAERGNTKVEIWTNNSSDGGTTISQTPEGTSPIIYIGTFGYPVNYGWTGFMQETIIYPFNPSDYPTYRNSISTDLNSYYNVY